MTTMINNKAKKFSIAAFAAVAALSIAAPAANADIVDDALARIPAGEITCEQANEYWTTEAEYNDIRQMAQAAAPFHPRGGEITDALNRVHEAAQRCGLIETSTGGGNGGGNGGGGNNAGGNEGSALTNLSSAGSSAFNLLSSRF